MAACLKAGGSNHIHARLLEGDRFVHGGCSTNQRDSPAAKLVQDLFGRNAENEAECGDSFLQENLYLVFEADWIVRPVGWLRPSRTFNMFHQRREAAMECLFRCGECPLVLH